MKLAICAVWCLSGAFAFAAVAGGPKASNPRIPAVLASLKAGKLEQAEAELRLAKAYEGSTSVDLGQLAILEGVLSAASANDEQARAAFRRALSLDPRASLPDVATARTRKMFDAVRAEVRAASPGVAAARGAGGPGSPGSPRNLPAELEPQFSAGKLQAAKVLLDAAEVRDGLTQFESGQILTLRGLLAILQNMQKGMSPEACRSNADDLEVAEAGFADAAAAQLTDAESAQLLALRSLVLVTGGMLRAESGEEDRARASFRKALELNRRAKVPSLASARARRLFDETRAAVSGSRGPGRKP